MLYLHPSPQPFWLRLWDPAFYLGPCLIVYLPPFNIMVTGHLLPQTASHLPAPSGLETCYGKIFWVFFLTNCFPDCYISALSLWCPVTASEWWWRSLELLDTVYQQPGRKSRVGLGRLIVSSRSYSTSVYRSQPVCRITPSHHSWCHNHHYLPNRRAITVPISGQ